MGTMPLARIWAGFQSLPPLPTSKLRPSWCLFPGRWVCVHSRTLCVSPMNSLVRVGVSPTTTTPTGFSVRSFEALFSHAVTLGCTVCLAAQFFLPFYLNVNVGLSASPATTSPSSPAASPALVL